MLPCILLLSAWIAVFAAAFLGLLYDNREKIAAGTVVFADFPACDLVIVQSGAWYAVVQPMHSAPMLGATIRANFRKGSLDDNLNVIRAGITRREADETIAAECVIQTTRESELAAGPAD
jgi:hypothetical protein